MKYLALFISFFTSYSVLAQDIDIETSPEKAEIWLKKNPTDVGTKIGETPYKGKMIEVFSASESGETSFLEIKMEGFTSKELILLGQMKKQDLKLNLKLNPKPEVDSVKKHDLLFGEILKAQKMIRSKNYQDAINKLTVLEKDHPNFSIISELKGITYYMSKDMEKALSMFRMAFSQNPDNVDAYRMKVYLERKLNISAEGTSI